MVIEVEVGWLSGLNFLSAFAWMATVFFCMLVGMGSYEKAGKPLSRAYVVGCLILLATAIVGLLVPPSLELSSVVRATALRVSASLGYAMWTVGHVNSVRDRDGIR